jgi:hypothetical protein
MSGSDYIPDPDDAFGRWIDQFVTAANSTDAAPLNLTTAQKTALAADQTDFHQRLADVSTTRAAARQAVQDKDNSRRLAEQHFRALAQQIVTNPACTPALRALFGITAANAGGGGATPSAEADAQPTGKAKALRDGHVDLKSDMDHGRAEELAIYEKRGTETAFSLLAVVAHPHFVDTRPLLVAGQPETRYYQIFYRSHDAEYGVASDIIVVTAAP